MNEATGPQSACASGDVELALFDQVYAPTTLGTLLLEFSFGHARQLESVLREHLISLFEHTPVLTGLAEQAFIDVDSLLRPVYGRAKQGASHGHTKIAGKQVLRMGLSPLATTISTVHQATRSRAAVRDTAASAPGRQPARQGSAPATPTRRRRPRR